MKTQYGDTTHDLVNTNNFKFYFVSILAIRFICQMLHKSAIWDNTNPIESLTLSV